MIRLPPPLAPGARIGVFAPSGIFDPARLAVGFELLREWGYEPVAAPNIYEKYMFMAGADALRQSDMLWALTDPSLDAAWMARGGYGLGRILAGFPWEKVPSRPVVGFSDGTLLMLALRQRAGLAGVHGPVLQSLPDWADEDSRKHLRRLLAGERRAGMRGRVLVAGEAEGPLVGGNLCCLASVAGTPFAVDARGCVLVLEDVGEAPYKVDRLLVQLRDSGALDGVVGVAVGRLTDTRVPEGADWTMDQVWLDLLGPLGVPVLVDLPIGHDPQNIAFLHGYTARIEGDSLAWGRR